jgi:hypothetical protein
MTTPLDIRQNGLAVTAESAVAGEVVLGTGWQALAPTPTPCSAVLLSAATALHPNGKSNSGNVAVRVAGSAPTSTAGANILESTNIVGFILPVGSTGLVWVSGTSGDAVEWQALQG